MDKETKLETLNQNKGVNMGLLELLLLVALIGLFVWVITTFIPMDNRFKQAIVVIAIIAVLFYVLQLFGLFHDFHDIRLGK